MKLNPDKHLDAYCVVILGILAYVLFFHQLGGIGFVGPDEPRYAAVAREMLESGDFVTPRLMGMPWFEKPVLMYWLAALGSSLLGVGEIGARLPSAMAATIAVMAVFWCGRKLYSRMTGMAAALILATSVGFVALARAASMDMLLSASLACAMAFFLLGQNSAEPERRRYFYGFYAALGLGVLAKGPVAILLPAASLAIFLIWRAGTGEWRRWHPEGLAITALVAAPWHVAVIRTNGWAFIEEFFLNHNVQRFVSEVHGHDQPFYYFVPIFVAMMFPWTFFAIPAFGRRLDKNEHLMVTWAAVPFLFFSLSGAKLPAYILPMAAPVALLVAREIVGSRAAARFRLAVGLEALFWLSAGIVVVFFADLVSVDLPIGRGIIVLGLTGGIALAVMAAAFLSSPRVVGIVNVLSVLGLVLLVTGIVFPNAQSVESMRPWVAELDQFVSVEDEVLLYKPPRWMEYGLEYYLARPALSVESEEQLIEVTESGSRYFCISQTRALDELSSSDRLAIEVVQAKGSQTAFWIRQP